MCKQRERGGGNGYYYNFSLLQIQEIDLKNTLNVIGQLWELVEETQTSCDNTRDQLRELEEKWKEEKGMRRLVEKVIRRRE